MISYQQIKLPKLQINMKNPSFREAMDNIRNAKSQFMGKKSRVISQNSNIDQNVLKQSQNPQQRYLYLKPHIKQSADSRDQQTSEIKVQQKNQTELDEKMHKNYSSSNQKYLNIYDVNSYSMDNDYFATRQRLKNQAQRNKKIRQSKMQRSNKFNSSLDFHPPFISLKNPQKRRQRYLFITKSHNKNYLKTQENTNLENMSLEDIKLDNCLSQRKSKAMQESLSQLTQKQIQKNQNSENLRQQQPKGIILKETQPLIKSLNRRYHTIVQSLEHRIVVPKNHQKAFSLAPYLMKHEIKLKKKSPLYLQDYLKMLVQKIPKKHHRRNEHNMRQILNFLEEFNRFFFELKETIAVCLLKSNPIKIYNKGRQIYNMGQDYQSFYIIIHGKVKIYNLLTGMRIDCQTGDTICEEILYSKGNKRVRFQSAIARTTTFLMEVKMDTFRKMKQQFEHFGYFQDQRTINRNLKENYQIKSKIRKQHQRRMNQNY